MKIAVLPGDGVGPEVSREAIRVLSEVGEAFGIPVQTSEHLVGGAAIHEARTPLPDSTLAACLESDAVLLGAVGTPEFDDLPPERRPEAGLLRLRKELGGFANLRPSRAVPALIDSSPLRKEIVEGTDLLIVRELLGGLYFGAPRGFNDERTEGFNTMRYSAEEVRRVAEIAFQAAQGRRKKLASVDKANVLETSQLWRKTVSDVSKNFPDVELEHLYVDACAMHLVTNPTRFDVILTENLFGDILSDEAAVLTGSLGMLASATIGGKVDLYEPVHGSAPNIAGRNIANPVGAIASVAMMLRHSAKHEPAAVAIESAIDKVLELGYRTADIAEKMSSGPTSTETIGRLVAQYAVEAANTNLALHAI